MNLAAFSWLCAVVVFLLAEAATVTVVSLWFAGGALAAMVAALLGGAPWVQWTAFLVVSVGLLAALRPLARKYLKPRVVPTNIDAVIGSKGIVTEAVDNIAAAGQVKLGHMEWTARSTTGEPIEAGTQIQVDRIEGVKVYVSKCKAAVDS